MNQEETQQAQLAEERAETPTKEVKNPAKTKRAGSLRALLKNPFIKLLFPFLGELASGGILPCWTVYIVYSYYEERKSGASPNLAEYLIVGGLAGTVDIMGLLGLTGVLLILSLAISVPCLCLLWVWRIHKHGLKSAMPTKKA